MSIIEKIKNWGVAQESSTDGRQAETAASFVQQTIIEPEDGWRFVDWRELW